MELPDPPAPTSASAPVLTGPPTTYYLLPDDPSLEWSKPRPIRPEWWLV